LSETIPFWERLLVIDERGVTLYSDHYYNDDYSLIIGGLFQAIETVFTTEFDDELTELRGVKYHVSLIKKQVNSTIILFLGLTHSTICEKKRFKELEFVATQFIKQYHPVITDTIDDPALFNDFKKTPKTRKESALTQISESLQFNPKIFSSKITKREILRILAFLKLPRMLKLPIHKKTRNIYENVIRSGSKFKQVKKLIPITLYLYCSSLGIIIDKRELINVSHITARELKAALTQIKQYLPHYFD